MAMSVTALPLDYTAIKQRQQAVWSAGDYAIIGTTLQIVGERLCEAVDMRAGSSVLDVAAGNGNATLAAARRFAHVTSTDYVGALLERGKERAAAERLAITFRDADAEALPFARWQLRRGAVHVRRHVHPEPGKGSRRTRSRRAQRREDRAGELDARWIYRPAPKARREARAAAGGHQATDSLGHRSAPWRAVCRA